MDKILISLALVAFLVGLSGGVSAESGLVAEYHFDDNAQDSSGNGNDGTNNGATYTTGVSGQALSFDGVNDYVEVPNSASLQFTSSTPFSIDGWINVGSFTTGEVESIIAKWGDAGGEFGYGVIVNTDRKLHFSLDQFGSHRNNAIGATVIAANTWYHFAATYDGTTMQVYLNGVLEGSTTKTVSGSASSTPLKIGGQVFEPGAFTGLIDEVKIYSRALSASEVQANYDADPSAGGGGGGPATTTATTTTTTTVPTTTTTTTVPTTTVSTTPTPTTTTTTTTVPTTPTPTTTTAPPATTTGPGGPSVTMAPPEKEIDSDRDGWSDEYEQKVGTDPYIKDTDNDGIIDSQDLNPLVPEKGICGPTAVLLIAMLPVAIYRLRRMR